MAASKPTDEAVVRLAIEVEKRLCALLGREWSAAGFSVETLLDEVGERLMQNASGPSHAGMTWDHATARECARRALDCRVAVADLGDDTQASVAASNQAVLAYHSIMKLIEPERSLQASISEARGILSK